MENKRLTNKLNSWFWWVLCALPLILLLLTFIGGIPQCAKNFDWANLEWYEFIGLVMDDTDIYSYAFNQFGNFSIPFITNTFFNLFDSTFDVNQAQTLSYLFGWLLSVQIYHLIYDVLKFIIEWCHNLIERGVN